jgi:hypothetical protein
MQETPAEKLLPILVERIRAGTELKTLTAAAALANARTFGGEDYVGYHTLMALSPAYHMARELPPEQAPLPVLKVLYRNASRMTEVGGASHDALHPAPKALDALRQSGTQLRDAVRGSDLKRAELVFSATGDTPEEMFNALLTAVEDSTEVHRVVLPYRAWDLLDIVGREHAHTMLRQSVHYCVQAERWINQSPQWKEPRTLLPKVLDEYHLAGKTPGTRAGDDSWVDQLSQTIFNASPTDAARAVGSALAEGFEPKAIGEAISLAANQLVLRDVGRQMRDESPGKPMGSVHGDSIGVHACDSANAWRNMARVAEPRHQIACLILAAYQVAFDRDNRGGDFRNWTPAPLPQHVAAIKDASPESLLTDAESAIRGNLQARASAVVHRYGQLNFPARPIFDLMLKFATSEDGALHAEKYYRTVSEEFSSTREAFRWRQLVALARVTASEYGRPAPGVESAKQMLLG